MDENRPRADELSGNVTHTYTHTTGASILGEFLRKIHVTENDAAEISVARTADSPIRNFRAEQPSDVITSHP